MLSLPSPVNQDFLVNFGRDKNFQSNPSPVELERRDDGDETSGEIAQYVLRSFELEMDQFRALF